MWNLAASPILNVYIRGLFIRLAVVTQTAKGKGFRGEIPLPSSLVRSVTGILIGADLATDPRLLYGGSQWNWFKSLHLSFMRPADCCWGGGWQAFWGF
jgi:hypothetical protein